MISVVVLQQPSCLLSQLYVHHLDEHCFLVWGPLIDVPLQFLDSQDDNDSVNLVSYLFDGGFYHYQYLWENDEAHHFQYSIYSCACYFGAMTVVIAPNSKHLQILHVGELEALGLG